AVDLKTMPARLQLAAEILMGEIPTRELRAGEAMAIPTGGYLPPGADAGGMQEDTKRLEDVIEIQRVGKEGENVQSQGEDFRGGAVLFHAGHRLRPQDLAAIKTFGVQKINVYRLPVLRVISTGNELVNADADATAGKIRETNAIALTSAAKKFG